MSEENEPLAFDRAETIEPKQEAETPACGACKRALGKRYFTLNEAPICEDCHHLLDVQLKEAKGVSAFMRATGFGAAAALGGSIAWYLVARITGMEIGLIAIAVGYVVGRSVRRGSRGPGGRRYQALAMLLTYLSITGSYVPGVMKSLSEIEARPKTIDASHTLPGPAASEVASAPAPASTAPVPTPTTKTNPTEPSVLGSVIGLVVVFAIAFIAPFLGGASNILGLVLIAIALYEAWKLNRAVPFILDGPHRRKRTDVASPET